MSMPPDRLSSSDSHKTLRQPRRNASILTTLCHPRAISSGRARYTFLIMVTCASLSFSQRMITTLRVTLVLPKPFCSFVGSTIGKISL